MRIRLLLLLSLVLPGCDLLTGPGTGAQIYHFHGIWEDARIDAVDLETGAVETVFEFGEPMTWAFAFHVHGSSLFTATKGGPDGPYRLHEVDLCSMDLRWTLELGTPDEDPRTINGITFRYPHSPSVSPDGERLYVSGAFRNDTAGVVVLDRQTQQPIGFIGPFEHRVARELPAVPGYNDGVVLVNGMRTDSSPSVLYFFDRATFELMDSIPSARVELAHWYMVEPSVDGNGLYGSSINTLFRYDFGRAAVVAEYAPDGWLVGWVTEAPDGKIVAFDWPSYGPDYPGSGLVYVFGPDLELIGEVDVSTPVGGEPYSATAVRTEWAVISRDGKTAYVAARERYYGKRPWIFAIDLETLSVSNVVEIGGGSIGRLIAPPEC